MNCFNIFKEKSKSNRGVKSAPEAREKSRVENSESMRTTRSLPSPRTLPELYKEKEHNLRVFSLQELKEATNDFNKLLKVGEGGFGSVYKGTVRPSDGQGDRLSVAIKKLNTRGMQVNSYFCCCLYGCMSDKLLLDANYSNSSEERFDS